MTICDQLDRAIATMRAGGHTHTPVHNHVLKLLVDSYRHAHRNRMLRLVTLAEPMKMEVNE